jgi:hypothetical protein
MMTSAELIAFENLINNKFGAHTYGAPCFLYVTKRVLKVIEDVWSVDREPTCVLYVVLHV